MIQHCKKLYYRRNKYDKSRSISVADQYIAELEAYVPNEIIDEYSYEQAFKEVLSLVSETFRPDHFDSYFGGLFHWLDFEFMEWLILHQGELKRRLSWNQVCELQCNWMGWNLMKMLNPEISELTLKEMWNYDRTRTA